MSNAMAMIVIGVGVPILYWSTMIAYAYLTRSEGIGRMIYAGEIAEGPDGQAYIATRAMDLSEGYVLMMDDFTPMGGAPEPQRGERAPDWFNAWIGRKVFEHSEGHGG